MQKLRKKRIHAAKSGVWALPPVAPQPADAPPKPAIERRAFVRHLCDIGVVVAAWPAIIQDISRGGVKAVVSRRFEVGTVLKLEVTIGNEENVQIILARVARVIQEPTGMWSLGCSFVKEISQEEMDELLTMEAC